MSSDSGTYFGSMILTDVITRNRNDKLLEVVKGIILEHMKAHNVAEALESLMIVIINPRPDPGDCLNERGSVSWFLPAAKIRGVASNIVIL